MSGLPVSDAVALLRFAAEYHQKQADAWAASVPLYGQGSAAAESARVVVRHHGACAKDFNDRAEKLGKAMAADVADIEARAGLAHAQAADFKQWAEC